MYTLSRSNVFIAKHGVNLLKPMFAKIPHRNIQISLIGAANDVGSNLALLMKLNPRISRLHLFDDDEKVSGIVMELNQVPGTAHVHSYSGGDYNALTECIAGSNLIVVVTGRPRKPGTIRDQMLIANAPNILKICNAMICRNTDAFLAIATNPINSIIPFASSILTKHRACNPFKIFGITHIDLARSKVMAAEVLNANPRHIDLPVIGGHSEETIVPIFSNMRPDFYTVNPCQVDMLTRLVKTAGIEVVKNKYGNGSANISMAWSVNEFVDGIIDAIFGNMVTLHCYTANPNFGTRYFSGPNIIGPYGLVQACHKFNLSQFECTKLSEALRAINKDVSVGEEYARVMA